MKHHATPIERIRAEAHADKTGRALDLAAEAFAVVGRIINETLSGIAALRGDPTPWLAFRDARVATTRLVNSLDALDLRRATKKTRRAIARSAKQLAELDATLVQVWMTNYQNEAELLDARFLVDHEERIAAWAMWQGVRPSRMALAVILRTCGRRARGDDDLLAQIDSAKQRRKREDAARDRAEKGARKAIRRSRN